MFKYKVYTFSGYLSYMVLCYIFNVRSTLLKGLERPSVLVALEDLPVELVEGTVPSSSPDLAVFDAEQSFYLANPLHTKQQGLFASDLDNIVPVVGKYNKTKPALRLPPFPKNKYRKVRGDGVTWGSNTKFRPKQVGGVKLIPLSPDFTMKKVIAVYVPPDDLRL